MAKIKSKGTVFKQDISSVLTAVAQVISLNTSGAETETFDADTLDNSDAGIPYDPTGRAEGGSVDMSLFFDPALIGHQEITDYVTTPAKRNHSITFADDASTAWTFTAAGLSFGVAVELANGLVADVSYKVDKLISYAT